MSPEEYFATLWPELVPKLRTMLARAGAPVSEREDLVQETALRLYRMWPTVDQERGVDPLARRIAMNAWRDQWRRRGEREVLGDVPDEAGSHDTERTALARVEVREVSRALGRLRPATAAVLRMAAADAESDAVEGGTPPALRMARCRARRALQASLRVASAAIIVAVAAARALGRPARTGLAAGAVATVALVLTLSTAAAPNSHPGRIEVWPATALRVAAEHPAATGHAAAAPSSGRIRTAPVAHRAAPRRAAKPTPYYVVHAGPSDVRAFSDVPVEGYGLRVQNSPANGPMPICGYGATPNSPVNPRCP